MVRRGLMHHVCIDRFKYHNRVHFAHRTESTVALNSKDLTKLELFSIGVKELIEHIQLQIKSDGSLFINNKKQQRHVTSILSDLFYYSVGGLTSYLPLKLTKTYILD